MRVHTKTVWDIATGQVLEDEWYEYEGEVAEAKGGGGQQTTVQKADPWEGQQAYLKDIFSEAQNQYNNYTPTYFPGQTVAGYNPLEQQAQAQTLGFALGDAQNQIGNLNTAQQFALGDVLNPSSNQYLQAHAKGAIQPITEELTQSILPSIRQGAVQAGQYGGSRQGLAEGQAVDKATQNMLNTTSQIYSDAYNTGLDTFNKGLALAPQTMQTNLLPAQLIGDVGAMNRQYEQALINDAISRHNFEQQLPYTSLAQYQQLIQGNYGGSSMSETMGGSSGGFLGGLGGAMSGFSAGSWLGGTSLGASLGGASVLGPIGAGLGLLSAFL